MTITWTKCSVALPEKTLGIVLLACADGIVTPGSRFAGIWLELGAGEIADCDVTHWAHLPAHPDEEDA